MNTPWGLSHTDETITRGVHWVTTAGHGGLMVSNGVAAKALSERAIAVAHPGKCGGYVCFEEDCSYAVAFFEHPEWKRFLDQQSLAEWQASTDTSEYMQKAKADAVPKLTAKVAKTDDAIREDMRAIVQRWNAKYFGDATAQPLQQVLI